MSKIIRSSTCTGDPPRADGFVRRWTSKIRHCYNYLMWGVHLPTHICQQTMDENAVVEDLTISHVSFSPRLWDMRSVASFAVKWLGPAINLVAPWEISSPNHPFQVGAKGCTNLPRGGPSTWAVSFEEIGDLHGTTGRVSRRFFWRGLSILIFDMWLGWLDIYWGHYLKTNFNEWSSERSSFKRALGHSKYINLYKVFFWGWLLRLPSGVKRQHFPFEGMGSQSRRVRTRRSWTFNPSVSTSQRLSSATPWRLR